MDLSIVIVSKNTVSLLNDCLESLASSSNTLQMEVWVVDNASTDGSVQMVQTEYPQVRLIANEDNVGFAHANNQALVQARGRYCLLLNPDTLVPVGALDKLIQFMDDVPDASVVGCAQIYPDGRRQVTCHRAITLTREAIIAFGLAHIFRRTIDYREDISDPRQVDWVEGGALLARRSVLSAIGMMDENFFMYVEDAELCFRVWQANWSVYYIPDVQIIHYRGQSTGFEQRKARQQRINGKLLIAMHQSKAYFIRKHYGAYQEEIYQLLVRVYSIRKLSMGLMFYMLQMMERETWRNFSRAYVALLKANIKQ